MADDLSPSPSGRTSLAASSKPSFSPSSGGASLAPSKRPSISPSIKSKKEKGLASRPSAAPSTIPKPGLSTRPSTTPSASPSKRGSIGGKKRGSISSKRPSISSKRPSLSSKRPSLTPSTKPKKKGSTMPPEKGAEPTPEPPPPPPPEPKKEPPPPAPSSPPPQKTPEGEDQDGGFTRVPMAADSQINAEEEGEFFSPERLFIWAICCAVTFPPLGLPSIYFAHKAVQAKKDGELETMKSKAMISKALNTIANGILVILLVAIIVSM